MPKLEIKDAQRGDEGRVCVTKQLSKNRQGPPKRGKSPSNRREGKYFITFACRIKNGAIDMNKLAVK